MHVLYFHQYFTTRGGSAGTRSFEMARALVARGHRVTMVCANTAGADAGLTVPFERGVRCGEVDGIAVVQLEIAYSNYDSLLKRALVFARFAWRSILVAWKTEYDLLFATSTPLTVGITGIVMRLLKRKPFVFEVRDLWPELPKAMGVIRNPVILHAMGMLEWLAYRTADACVALAPGIKEGIAKRGVPDSRIASVPNGCDLEFFAAAQRDSFELPPEARGKLVAVFSGAHGLANGLHRILDAAAELKRRSRSDIHLLFVGDGKVKPELVERARREELTNCSFIDPIPKISMPSLLASVHVGLMVLDNVPAFYYGTSPNKFFDYIAAGLPVLNNYPGWLAGLIEGARCGLVSRPHDAVSFADALVRFADFPEERVSMGVRARTLAESEFGRDRLARLFCENLERVHAGAKGAARAVAR